MSGLSRATPVAFVLVRNRKAGKPFYDTVLGLTQIAGDANAADYNLNGLRLRLTAVEDHRVPAHGVIGCHVPDIGSAIRDLAARGVSLHHLPRLWSG